MDKILIKDGPIMASPDDFSITITGKSGHAACPEDCINPISAASELITEFHKLPSEIPDSVVTVCNINGGTGSPNIIPDTVTITGTARMITPETRDLIESNLKKIAKKICKKYDAKLEFKYYRKYPPLINNKEMNDIVKRAALKSGVSVEIQEKCSMTGEDFAYFAERVPSSFFKLGTGNETLGMYPLHNAQLYK